MTPVCPDIPPTARYSITESARLLGITARHLHRLARKGEIKYTVSAKTGRKIFTGKEIMRFWNEH